MAGQGHGPRTQAAPTAAAGPLPGEEVCFECGLHDCVGEDGLGCGLRAARDAWRAALQERINRALGGEGRFVMQVPNSRHRQSVVGAARTMVPGSVIVRTELERTPTRFLLIVELVEK